MIAQRTGTGFGQLTVLRYSLEELPVTASAIYGLCRENKIGSPLMLPDKWHELGSRSTHEAPNWPYFTRVYRKSIIDIEPMKPSAPSSKTTQPEAPFYGE